VTRRRSAIVALRVWAVMVLALATSRLFVDADGHATAPPAPAPARGALSSPAAATEPVLPPLSQPPPTVSAVVPAEVQIPPTAPSTTAPPPAVPPPPVVNCKSNVPLAESPDAPYAFLCLGADDVPITWPNDRITLYAGGLSAIQSTALQAALVEWQDKARLTVTEVDSPANAQVILTQADLPKAGGRTIVKVFCDPICVITHADVRLSTTQPLAPTTWIALILHELGHAAGLSHVTRTTELMYPELSETAPLVYGAGDRAGLTVLANRRPS
jgi:hypothetical protein